MIWSFRVLVAPGGVKLRPWRSQEVRGSPSLGNGGLRALGEAWDDFLLEAFFCQVWYVFRIPGACLGGSRLKSKLGERRKA